MRTTWATLFARWKPLFVVLSAILVLKVTAAVVIGYREYWPPNFQSDFLFGRETYFFDGYHLAFYTHIATGPVTLILGTLLVSDRFLRRWRGWHRTLGKVQVLTVVALTTPSGLVMAFHAAAGPWAGLSFVLLALATCGCTLLGWRTAVRRQFAAHRRWMWRSYLLLCSAVVLRLFGGFALLFEIAWPWYDVAAAWVCWVGPIVAYEMTWRVRGLLHA